MRPRRTASQDDAFRTTILPHLDAAYSLARYLVRDPATCDEIVQDSFERAIKGFHTYRGGSAKAWLLTIVRNCCRTRLTTTSRLNMRLVSADDDSRGQPILSEMPDPAESPEEGLIRQEGIAYIRAQIEQLPEPFREALVLRELEELSYKEIGEVTGVALGTVMSRLFRARSVLAEALLAASAPVEAYDRKARDEQLR